MWNAFLRRHNYTGIVNFYNHLLCQHALTVVRHCDCVVGSHQSIFSRAALHHLCFSKVEFWQVNLESCAGDRGGEEQGHIYGKQGAMARRTYEDNDD